MHRHAEFSSSDVANGPNIVQLADMKQNYALAQARQKLRVVADAAVAQSRSSFTYDGSVDKGLPWVICSPRCFFLLQIIDLYVLDARDTSILLVRYGYIDEATSLALLFNQDLDIIFDSLVDKYLAALTTEQEDLTSKDRVSESSWASANKHRSASTLLSLQNYLERYDNAESNYRYRLEVVERILSRNGDFNLQPWITLHYLVCLRNMPGLFDKLRTVPPKHM